jgi:ankyrin repeat protein
MLQRLGLAWTMVLVLTLGSVVTAQKQDANPAKQAATAQLFDAIKAGDSDAVKRCVQGDRTLLKSRDERVWNKPTPLHAAAGPNRAALWSLLLSLGADPNQADGQGDTVMHLLKFATVAQLEEAIKAGGNVNATDRHGMTLLHHTTADARLAPMTQALIQHGADVNLASRHGLTPLHIAAHSGQAAALLDAGSDPGALDQRGRTPAFNAADPQTLALLAKHGAALDAIDITGWSTLHEASWHGRVEVVRALLEAHVALGVDREGNSPLHAAARTNQAKVVPLLLAAGVDPLWRDGLGQTALDIATARKFDAAVAALQNAPSTGAEPRMLQPKPSDKPDDQLQPGTLDVLPPTLNNLGFRWFIAGDANRNATCAIEYRRAGDEAWTPGYPALRMGGEVSGGGYVVPHQFGGSVLDLAPDTSYEVRLTAHDPDGVQGEAQHVLKLSTRGEPREFDGGRKLHVYPASVAAGQRQSPHFSSIQHAYQAADAGDTVLIHAGQYREDLVLNKRATAQRPIVIRSVGDGEVRLQGQGNFIINVEGSEHHIIEGLTLFDADEAIHARGRTVALTVRRCTIRDVAVGVMAISPDNRDFLITDCDMRGPVKDWHPRREEKSQGVWISGQGHVVQFCRVKGYWDGLSIYGRIVGESDRHNAAIDFLNNDLREFLDDAIELDYGVSNLRCARNFIRNTFMGISTQPVEGGPGYIYRNVVYATTRSPLKLNVQPSGLLIFHNTFIANAGAGSFTQGFQNTLIYNNLFVGRAGEWTIAGGSPSLWTDLDANAYRDHRADPKRALTFWIPPHPWFSPHGSGLSGEHTANSLDEFCATSLARYERHGGWPVDYSDFVLMRPPNVEANQHDEEPIDVRPTRQSVAIDRGRKLTFFNDGFSGARPDLGAYELDAPLSHYGPRQ